MSIHEADTVETLAPRQRTWNPLALLFLLLCLAALAAGVAITVSPEARTLLGVGVTQPVPLMITSTPEGADVYVDDRRVGRTPVLAEVVAEEHTVRVVRRGYQPWRQIVYPALSPEVNAELEPIAFATLQVESVPDHANVFLDEAYRGTTPLRIPKVEAGRHVLRVEKNHVYQPVMKEVELKQGETLDVMVPLVSNLEQYYLACIKESPKKLSNYTDFIHIHVLDRAPGKAVDVILQAVAALKGGKVDPAELAPFTSEITSVYGGSAGPLDDATRKKLLDGLLVLFEQVAGTSGSSYSNYTPIASLLIQAGRTQDVIAVCDRLGTSSKRPGYLHYQIGRAIAKTSGSATALAVLARSIELNPDYYPSHYYVGTIHHRNGDLDKAMASYQAAEKLLTKGASSYYQGLVQYNIARVLAAKEDVAGAIARYEKALAVKTSSSYLSEWRLAYAQFLATNGKNAEAIKQYTELRRTATSSTYRYAAIKALKRLGATPKKD